MHVFGEYVDVYDIRQAVEDGATRPLYDESRIVKLKVDEEGARVAEEEVEYVVNADRKGEHHDKAAEDRFRVPLESLVGAPERVERLAAFIVEHWEKRRAAMAACLNPDGEFSPLGLQGQFSTQCLWLERHAPCGFERSARAVPAAE